MKLSRREMLAATSAMLMASCGKETSESEGNIPSGSSPGVRRSADQPLGSRPNVIVFLSDALRADFLGCYGYSGAATPFVDAFSKESLLFQNCYSQANWTKPSVASLFTGLMPRVHRATRATNYMDPSAAAIADVIRDNIPTLAEHFDAAGYATGCFVVNPHIKPKFGFARGFQRFHHGAGIEPAGLVSEALSWLDGDAKEPFFTYIHVFDPHGPYEHGREHFAAVAGETMENARSRLSAKDLTLIDDFVSIYERKKTGESMDPRLDKLSQEGVQHLQYLYAAELRGVDAAFQKVYEHLVERDLLESTVLVFTSDHGEAFGEHWHFRHGVCLFNEEIRVPCIMRMPGGKGETVISTVAQFDLHASLLALAGITPPDNLQSCSVFLPNSDILTGSNRIVYTDQDLNAPVSPDWGASAVAGPWKVAMDTHREGTHYYDLELDPGEMNNLAEGESAPPPLFDSLRDELVKEKARLWEEAEKLGSPQTQTLTPEDEEELRAVGYL